MIRTKDYKTQTHFEERKNVCTNGVWNIALDAGYSAVKVMSPNIVASFPSIACKIDNKGFIGKLPKDCIRLKNHDTGELWLVGQAAQDMISDENTSISSKLMYTRNRFEDPMFKILIDAGLGIACMQNKYGNSIGKEIFVQTGLPLEYLDDGTLDTTMDIDSDKERLTDIIAGKHNFSIWIGEEPERKYSIYINRKNIFTIDQPRGTLFSVAIDNEGNVLPGAETLFSRKGIVFDAGFGTLDIFSLKNNKIDSGQTWADLGMRAVMEETANLIREAYGIRISVPALQKYLESGNIRYHKGRIAKNVAFADMLEKASRKVCKQAIDRLFQTYTLYEYDYLIVTGGTGDAWKSYIKEELSGMETLEIMNGDKNDTLPMFFANVRGFYLYRLMHLKNR